jgi:putative transcriptional regulator
MKTKTKKINLVDELREGLEEMVAVEAGHALPHKAHRFYSNEDIKALRERTMVSQREFAGMIGVSERTYQDWEQGRRVPSGPAMNLLRVYEAAPELVTETLAVT